MTKFGSVSLALITLVVGMPGLALAREEMLCGADPRTDAHQCFLRSQLREEDGIRYAPLYSGGPKTVRPTNFTVHANCQTRVMHLKDRDGVSFGGGTFDATAISRELSAEICKADLPARKSRKG